MEKKESTMEQMVKMKEKNHTEQNLEVEEKMVNKLEKMVNMIQRYVVKRELNRK